MVAETETLALKVLRTDKTALQRLATAEGEAVSVVVRRLLREGLTRRGMLPLSQPSNILFEERLVDQAEPEGATDAR